MNYLVVFPTTGVCRAFTHFNLIQEWYNACTAPVLRPSDLADLRDHKGKVIPLSEVHMNIARRNHSNVGYDGDPETTWKMAHAVAEVINRPPRQDPNPSPQQVLRQGFLVDLNTAKTAIEEKMPKQAKVIVQCLIKAGYDFYTETEMRQLMLQAQADRVLKTKQDPWRILRYYRPLLSNMGVLVYQE